MTSPRVCATLLVLAVLAVFRPGLALDCLTGVRIIVPQVRPSPSPLRHAPLVLLMFLLVC